MQRNGSIAPPEGPITRIVGPHEASFIEYVAREACEYVTSQPELVLPRISNLRRLRTDKLVVSPHVPIELRNSELSLPVSGRIDESLLD
jgi:hypothetical protein